MDINVGDVYIRNLDKKVYMVKKIDNKMVVLEREEKSHRPHLCLINIFGLEKGYTKVPKST